MDINFQKLLLGKFLCSNNWKFPLPFTDNGKTKGPKELFLQIAHHHLMVWQSNLFLLLLVWEFFMLGCSFPHFVFGRQGLYDVLPSLQFAFFFVLSKKTPQTWSWFSGLLPNYHSMDGWLLNVENKVWMPTLSLTFRSHIGTEVRLGAKT